MSNSAHVRGGGEHRMLYLGGCEECSSTCFDKPCQQPVGISSEKKTEIRSILKGSGKKFVVFCLQIGVTNFYLVFWELYIVFLCECVDD